MRGVLFLIAIAGLIFILSNPFANDFSAENDSTPELQTKSHARSFLEHYTKPIRLDESMLVNLLRERDPFFQTPKITQLLKKNYSATNPMARAYGEQPYSTSTQVEDSMAHSDAGDAYLIHALYCDLVPFSPDNFKKLLTFTDGQGGYGDTHVLLVLSFLKHRNCVDTAEIDTAMAPIVQRIAGAEFSSTSYDIQAERIVFLYWAGKGDLVQKAWIDHLLAGQAKDGSWVDPHRSVLIVHATAFSLLALYYFNQGLPYQDPFTNRYAM